MQHQFVHTAQHDRWSGHRGVGIHIVEICNFRHESIPLIVVSHFGGFLRIHDVPPIRLGRFLGRVVGHVATLSLKKHDARSVPDRVIPSRVAQQSFEFVRLLAVRSQSLYRNDVLRLADRGPPCCSPPTRVPLRQVP